MDEGTKATTFHDFSVRGPTCSPYPALLRSTRTWRCDDAQQIRVWNAEIRTTHPDTAAQAYRLLTTIFNTAVEDSLLTHSPCKLKGASQHKNPERPVASVPEIASATKAMDEPYRLTVLLACYCRLRRSEVLGLQRKHVDAEHGSLRVEQAWTVSGGRMHLGPPKTEQSRRTVQIPSNVLPLLNDHLDRFSGDGPEGWLFPGQDGLVVTPRTLDRQWAQARTAIGRPDLCFHDLRHTGLTMVAMTGATLAETMAAGGHASMSAAIRYQHASQDRMTAMTEALAAMAEGRFEPLSPTKGHAGGTTPIKAESNGESPEPSAISPEHLRPTNRARRHRHSRRKSAGQQPDSESQALPQPREDAGPRNASQTENVEQPQRDSNPCLHLERVVSLATRRWGRVPIRAEPDYPIR